MAFKPKRFDAAVLNRMVEPLTVRVDRTVGGGRPTNIELPPKEGLAPGQGWTKAEVMGLSGWIVREWSGGGTYEYSVVDDAGTKLDWSEYYDHKLYPIKSPPTMPAIGDSSPQEAQIAQTAAQAMVSGESSWPPPASDYNSTISPAAPPVTRYQHPAPQVVMAQPTYVAAAAPAISNAEYEKRSMQAQLEQANARAAQMERAQIEAKHEAELERLRQDNDRKFEELKRSLAPKEDPAIAELKALVASLVSAKPLGPSPEMLAMQEENRRMREEREAEKRDREQERREAALMKQLSDMQAQTARDLASVRAEVARQPAGPDPVLTMMQESSRQQLDFFKDMLRQSQASMEASKAFMLTPRDMMLMQKESSTGLEDIKRGVTGLYTDLIDTQRKMTENLLQLQPQGESQGLALLKEGIQSAKDMADRYMGAKRDETVSTVRAQAEIAKAQAQVVTVQAEQQAAQHAHWNEVAQREATAREHDGAVPNGQNGVAGQPELPKPQPIEVVDATAVPAATGAAEVVRYGRTDSTWFTQALPHVAQLRDGVATYFDAIHATPPKLTKEGKPAGIDAEQAAENILQAVAFIVEQKAHIPAFSELFMNQRYTEFMDVLLPGTPAQFRADVMGHIITEMNDVSEPEDDVQTGDEP